MIFWTHLHRTRQAGLSRRATIRITGDVDRSDIAALDVLGADLQRMGHVHIDLSGVGYSGTSLATWLIDQQRAQDEVGGHLTVGHVPKQLERLLRDLGHERTLGGPTP